MGRKSRAEGRREEILAAFERCIAREGIEVPLERIADEAGIQRSLIRHYLGNRDELVMQVIERIAAAYPRRIAELLAPVAAYGAEGVLEVLFGDAAVADDWDEVIHAVVGTTQVRYQPARQRVAEMLLAMATALTETLGQIYPQASPEARYEVAYSVLCLAYANVELCWLGIDAHHSTLARASAARLLDALAA